MVEETDTCEICGRKKAIIPMSDNPDAGILIHFCLGYKENDGDQPTKTPERTDDG